MARRDFKTATHTPAANGRKSGRSTLIILIVGMSLGIGLTLALTQWLSAKPDVEEQAPTAKDSSSKTPATKHRTPPKPNPPPVESVSPTPRAPAARAVPTPVPAPSATAKPIVTTPAGKQIPRPDDFHTGFVKGKTPTITAPIKPREIYWLQVAALRKEEDARRLRARLLLLNLDVVITPSDDGASYRVRVGPYKTEALARENEGLLNRNNLTPRLIKEPVFP